MDNGSLEELRKAETERGKEVKMAGSNTNTPTDTETETPSRKRRQSDEDLIDEKKVKKIKKQKRIKGLAKQSEEVARIVETRLREQANKVAEAEDEAAAEKRKERKRKRGDSSDSDEEEDVVRTPKKHRPEQGKRRLSDEVANDGKNKKQRL